MNDHKILQSRMIKSTAAQESCWVIFTRHHVHTYSTKVTPGFQVNASVLLHYTDISASKQLLNYYQADALSFLLPPTAFSLDTYVHTLD